MPLTCPRCQRANPAEAVYCHFDGVVLRQLAAGSLPASHLPQEFVFPSGRRCRTYDDLVQGCQYEWEDAREMLRRGDFGRYLSSVGRMDLARSAEEAQAQADPDIALHEFLGSLPVNQAQGPKLDLHPRRFNLPPMLSGTEQSLRLTIVNQGKGLLQGKVTVSEGASWLWVEDHGDGRQCALKTAREQMLTLRVNTRGLPAPQSFSGKLTVITNGGVAEVPVRLDLTTLMFNQAPYQGANSPREMAERMRADPKPAVPLLESGEIARWFEANGWTFPIKGKPAPGVAAVQQFFEGMGLSKPPTVQLSEAEFRLRCDGQEPVEEQVVLRTTARKWVYAEVESNAPWLRVLTPSVSGPQQAVVRFAVDPAGLEPGKTQQGKLTLFANAGQTLEARVVAESERRPSSGSRWLTQPVLAAAVLAMVLRLLLAMPGDLLGRVVFSSVSQPPAGSAERWARSPLGESAYLRVFVLGTWWVGVAAGVWLLRRRGASASDHVCGAIAGAGAGLAGAATLGCLMGVLDAAPRAVVGLLPAGSLLASPWLATPLWIVLAVGWWGVLGGLAGFVLSSVGPPGQRLSDRIARSLKPVPQ